MTAQSVCASQQKSRKPHCSIKWNTCPIQAWTHLDIKLIRNTCILLQNAACMTMYLCQFTAQVKHSYIFPPWMYIFMFKRCRSVFLLIPQYMCDVFHVFSYIMCCMSKYSFHFTPRMRFKCSLSALLNSRNTLNLYLTWVILQYIDWKCITFEYTWLKYRYCICLMSNWICSL